MSAPRPGKREIAMKGGTSSPQQKLAEMMLRPEGHAKRLKAADLDGDGKFTTADLLLHTLERSGAWKRGAARPEPPATDTRSVKPGATLEISPLDSETAVLILGVGTRTYRLESTGKTESAWTYSVPADITVSRERVPGKLWILRDRILSDPRPIAILGDKKPRSTDAPS